MQRTYCEKEYWGSPDSADSNSKVLEPHWSVKIPWYIAVLKEIYHVFKKNWVNSVKPLKFSNSAVFWIVWNLFPQKSELSIWGVPVNT